MSDMRTAQRKAKGLDTSWSPFKLRKDKKDAKEKSELQQLSPAVNFEPNSMLSTTFVYSEEASDTVTSVSSCTLLLLEAIREDELEIVEDELANLTDRREINRTNTHGFALIHVAARYNLSKIINTLLEHGADVNIGTSEYRWTPLHLAARFNGLSTVDALLQAGADPSIEGKKGSTPLHFAARRGNHEIVKVLLEHPKIKVDGKDGSGKTALHLACSEGHREVCKLLLNYGASIKATTADKRTPLHNAILHGHSEVARMILNRATDKDVDTTEKQLMRNKDLQSNTVLHMAAWNNDVNTAKLCLDLGCDVNMKKTKESTPLHIAATKGNLEMAELLILHGAGVNMKDVDSKTPLHRASQFNQTKIISLLVKKGLAKVDIHDGEGRSPFLNAVAAGHIDSVKVLLKLGADLNATDLLMKTCVHIAIENGQLKILTMLLENGLGRANFYKADLWDRVPLHYAAKAENIKILELVLSKQKHLSYRDENQKTPLHLAAESSSTKHVEALARTMAGVNARDEHGRTPLHCAARKGQRKACVTLLNMGAEVDSTDNNGRTPLMWAVKRNNQQCAQVLIDFKASIDLQDANGDTALHVACGQDHATIVSLLLENGANLTLRNKRENACLEVAAKAGASGVAMEIVKHKRWVELEGYETKTGHTAISLLIANFPEAAEVALNQCVHHSPHLNISHSDYAVTYDFRYLDPGPQVKDCSKRFSSVEMMIKHKREGLLLHPLTRKFNERKWITLGRYGFIFDFFTYLMLLILLTVFTVKQREDMDFRPANLTDGSFKQKPSDVYKRDSAFMKSVPFIVMIFAILHICKEFFQIYMERWNYFKDTSNYLDWILYISTILFMAPYVTSLDVLDERFSGLSDPRSLWILGVVAIFVCYTNMMLFLRRYRMFGTYISMCTEVTKTILQVMVVFVYLVMGFSLVFYILFKEQDGFHTVFHSTLHVLVMMVGELDYGQIFVESIDEKNPSNQNPKNPFPSVAFFFIFLCLFLLTVALMNLLVGLAVGDTEKMKKLATIKRLALQIGYHIQIERSYPAFITQALYEDVYVDKPNRRSIYQMVMEWLKALYAEVGPEPVVEENKPTELAELREGMMKNKKRIKSIVTMLEAQNKLLRSLAMSINPNLKLPEDVEEASWRKDDTDAKDGRYHPSLETVKELSEEPTDGTSVDLVAEDKASKDDVRDSDS